MIVLFMQEINFKNTLTITFNSLCLLILQIVKLKMAPYSGHFQKDHLNKFNSILKIKYIEI